MWQIMESAGNQDGFVTFPKGETVGGITYKPNRFDVALLDQSIELSFNRGVIVLQNDIEIARAIHPNRGIEENGGDIET